MKFLKAVLAALIAKIRAQLQAEIKSVDTILASFNSTILHLEAVGVHHEAEADKHYAISQTHAVLVTVAEKEADRARKVAAQFKKLVKA